MLIPKRNGFIVPYFSGGRPCPRWLLAEPGSDALAEAAQRRHCLLVREPSPARLAHDVTEADVAEGRDLLGHARGRSVERAGLEDEPDTVGMRDARVHPWVHRRRAHVEVRRVVRLADVVHVLAVVQG